MHSQSQAHSGKILPSRGLLSSMSPLTHRAKAPVPVRITPTVVITPDSFPIPQEDAYSKKAPLEWYRKQTLNNLVKISPFYIVERTYPWVIALVALSILYIMVGSIELIHAGAIRVYFGQTALNIAGMVLVLRIAYLELWRRTLRAEVDGFILRISQGIARFERVSIPLTPMVSIHSDQNRVGAFLGTYSIDISSANAPQRSLLSIPCMSEAVATNFKEFIAEQINRMGNVQERARNHPTWVAAKRSPATVRSDA